MPPTTENRTIIRCMGPDTTKQPVLEGDRIVITGISGLFAQANNVKEFSDILYNKENPITPQQSRWDYKHPELPEYLGMAPGIDRFDAQFFTVYHRLGHHMDPMSRKILEQTYQAIYDAGLSPGHLNGKKVGVFVGSSFSDTEYSGFFDSASRIGLGIIGASKTMYANRISYWLNIKGPSISIDEDDCSAIRSLEQAYQAIKRGECEAAIVGASHLVLHPQPLIHHGRLGVVSKDGTTKSYAENADGYSLSDSISVFLLQKSKDALRVYAEIVHAKSEFISVPSDETGPKYGYYRNAQIVADFIKEFYKETSVPPQAVEYVEGYGTAVPDADKSELEAIEKAYCEDRVDPLLVGSVSSNIGLTQSAAGLTGITKILLGYRNGKLAANLNCEHPRKDIKALSNGRMRIVNEHQPFNRTYTAVNGISNTGVNSHVLLNGHYKRKDLSRYKSSIPHLVPLSGRQETSVIKIFDNLKSRIVDPEELALLYNVHSKNISGHLGRGYIILDSDADNNTLSLCEKAEYFDDAKRPLWFVYSGMGSQWAGMGEQLMRIPIFASAIERCDRVLKPKGLDIVHIITTEDKTIFDNILHSFVGIAAIQIGLTDILTELGLEPDGIIGHSVGELGCAYADGCMTAEEMILAAYSRGLVSLQTPLISGSMAAVGLGYDQILSMCPPEIDVACRNSSESSTISGPADIMRQFVAELTAKQIFAKEVACSNIAYHSRYIANAGPNLLKYLKEVIKDPKPRNKRWVSTSVSQDKWDEPSAKLCSAEYHTNNLLSPVLFETTLRLIPSNAMLVEVAPHGLLQAILKRALPASCIHVPLTRRGHPNNVLFLLQALGDIYMGGYTLNLQNLYPKVQFPVSTETPMLSHLVEWIHSEVWTVILYNCTNRKKAATCKFVKSIHDDEYNYLRGHVVRGKMCYPFAAALVAVWDTFAMSAGLPKQEVSIKFHDLYLYAQPPLLDQQALKLNVAINRGTGSFEVVSEECSRVITGYISATKENKSEFLKSSSESNLNNNDMELTSDDIYQLLNDKAYNYDGEFRSIKCSNVTFNEAAILWRDNWVTFLDALLQLNTLRQPHQAFSQPTFIKKLLIDVKEHLDNHTIDLKSETVMKAAVSDIYDYTSCGGVLMQNIKFKHYPPVNNDLQLKLYVPPSEFSNVNKKNKHHDAKTRNETLRSAKFGKLDALHWVTSDPLGQSNLTVAVHYAALNMLDVKRATGITSFDSNSFGMDFSGITRSGERVMGIIKSGAASNYVAAQQELLWPVPKHWSLEEAATVPLAYAHAFYALKIKGRMEPGMRVLVHGGVGALGQAVIAIALAHKCQVFATVSNNSKKKLLQKLFPQLKDEYIGNSRDISFSDNILQATKGGGCDIVITSVKGEFKNLCLKCCGLNGILVDSAQIQDRENFEYGMYHMTRQRSYVPIDFSSVFAKANYEDMKILHNMMSEGIAAGYVVPLTRVIYARNEVTRAFRLLEASRHRGRVLLNMCQNAIKVEQRLICDPDKCQVIFWDNDSIGVHLVNRLVDRGARKLYICCKNITTYLHYKMRNWQQQGVKFVCVENVNTNISQAFNEANRLGVVEGIYVVITKANGKTDTEHLTTILSNLDSKSRLLCQQLRYFIVASTIKSSAQQICLSRSKSGYPATYLDLRSINQDQVISGFDIAEILERALCCPHVALLARAKRIQPPPILEQIAAVADIIIPKNTAKDVTLQELGVTDEKALSIGSVLNDSYSISLDEGIVPLLTIDKINDLQKSVMEITPPNERGLGTFFSNIGTDELLATADIVVLPTLFRDVISSHNDYDIEERYLCIVPGMEGHHEQFRVLCERLKLSALVLQPGLDHPHETAQETAQRYAEILIKKTKVLSKFYILGYESGVAVALELAAILEKRGLIGTVYCLGYAPEELQVELEEQLSDLVTKEQLQDAVVRHMYKLTINGNTEIIDKALEHAASWEAKKDVYVRCTMGRVDHSAQYVRGFLEAMLARIGQVRCYSAKTYSLRSQLVLLRAVSKHTPLEQFSLQRHSQQPIIMHQLRSDLSRVLNDMQCPSLINRYLDAETQADFDKQNLCHSYLVSTNAV